MQNTFYATYSYSTLKNNKKTPSLDNPYKINRVLKQVFQCTIAVA